MKSSRILIFAGLSFLLLLFQNCSGLKLGSVGNVLSFNSTLSESGNGGVYDGKPDATFYRYIPNFKCTNGDSAPAQVATYKNGHFLLFDTNGQQCSHQTTASSAVNVSESPFQSEFISINDFLFKKYEEKLPEIPTNLAEILCRDNFDKPTFEIIAHYNRETNEAVSRVYSKEMIETDFLVSRILSSEEVRYVSDKLSFYVNFTKVVEGTQRYAGRIESTQIGSAKTNSLTCVIGGSLDTSNWITKVLYEKSAESFNFLPNQEIGFLSEISRIEYGAYIVKIIHQLKIAIDLQITDFTKNMLGDEYSIFAQQPFNDKNFMIFWTKPQNVGLHSWYILDLKKSTTTRLTNISTSTAQEALIYTGSSVVTSTNEIFYATSFFVPNNEMVLRSYDVESTKITEIMRSPTNLGFGLLPISNQLLITIPINNALTLQLYDIKLKTSRTLSVPALPGCRLVGDATEIYDNERFFLSQATCSLTNGDNKYVLISLFDGQSKVIAANKSFLLSSKDRKWIIFGSNQTGQISAYNIITHEMTDLPSYVRLNYSNSANFKVDRNIHVLNNQFFYGFSSSSTSNSQMLQTDLQSGRSNQLCENALGMKISIGVIDDQKVFLLTYDSQLKVYRFYYAKSSTECLRLNEFPSTYENILRVIPASIGFSVTVGDGAPYLVPREAIFVPIDGRPPIKLSHNPIGPWQVELAPEKDRIILLGPDAEGARKIISFEFR